MNHKPRNILIVNPFGIGDVLFSMPLVQAIRAAYPEARIGFLANERACDVVRMSRAVDEVYMFNRDQFRRMGSKHLFLFLSKLSHFLSMIRRGRYDTLVDLSLGRQYSFFAAYMGIRCRIGFDYKGRGAYLNRKIKLSAYEGLPVAEKQLELLRFFEGARRPVRESFVWDYQIPEKFQKKIDELMTQLQLSPSRPFIIAAPGGGRSWGRNAEYKQWDAPRFAQVCKRLKDEQSVASVFAGDSYEAGLLNTSAEMARALGVVASEPLPVVAGLLKASRMLLCNDGGLMHLANMMGVKTVSLFGPVDEKVYGPYRQNVPSEVLTASVPCRPCYQKFIFPECRHKRQCLTQIDAGLVFETVKKVL